MVIRKRLLLTVIAVLMLLPLASREATDSVYTFRFVPNKDMFFVPFGENGRELTRLLDTVAVYKQDILDGKIKLHVDGYCRNNDERKALKIARIRSNRVKSELIVRRKVTEDCFVTHNHADDDDYVLVRMRPILPATPPVLQVEETPAQKPLPQMPEPEVTQHEELPSESEPVTVCCEQKDCGLPLSIRANLLRWVTLTPDLGIEWQVSDKWSALVHGTWTSWRWNDKDRRYALWEVTPEVRYHIYNKVYVGAQFKVGEFNYKLSETGKQGNLIGGGLTFGYVLPVSRRLSIDFGAALGYLHADYDKYVVNDAGRIKFADDCKNWWGPTSVGISLVYNFNGCSEK
ncbi:MAG: DUF3575 domain-containing protein [Prevotella sp.]